MRLRDYFGGRRFSLATRLPPEEVERQINSAAASIFSPVASGVIGWARFGRVRLRYRAGIFSYNGKPILAGRIVPDRSGARLELNYRAQLPLYVGFPLWYLAYSALLLVFLVGGDWAPGIGLPEKIGIVLFALAIGAAPIAVHYFATRNAEEELAILVDFLRRAVGATGAEELGLPRARP